jgi:hypothetical protein
MSLLSIFLVSARFAFASGDAIRRPGNALPGASIPA